MIGLSISNIAWAAGDDETVYGFMKELGYTGLEIAPTRLFPEAPYDRLDEAKEWSDNMYSSYGIRISSMQSIWYGRNEMLFGTEEERKILTDYTKKAVGFASATGCGNLVFGCPRNRNMPDGADRDIALRFFKETGDHAAANNTVIAMEANPPVYNTNYINDTLSATELVKEVGSKGFMLNLDLGTMIANGENLSVLKGNEHLISHVHISEPGLKMIEKRELHRELAVFLKESGYDKYVSIEMGKQENVSAVRETMEYIKETFELG